MEIPNSVTSIGDGAFYGSGLTSVEIPNSVTSIGYGAFKDCYGLTSVEIPNSVTSIEVDAFRNCLNLASVVLPNSITIIQENLFYNCTSLKSLTIPSSVTTIAAYALKGCTGLTSAVIGSSVTTIGDEVFFDCSSLKELVSLNTTPPTINDNWCFKNVPTKTCVLKVPAESVEDYKSAEMWNRFRKVVGLTSEEIEQITAIESPVFNSQSPNTQTFNLSGQPVGVGYKGIVIQNGRKIIK